jgi:hypothetical protein
MEHYNATAKRGITCSSQWAVNASGKVERVGGNCVGCHMKFDQGSKAVNCTSRFAFLFLHLDDYYLVPARDEEGNVRTYAKDGDNHKQGDVIYNRMSEEDIKYYGERKDKELLKEFKRGDFEQVYGALRYWSMGSQFRATLIHYAKKLEKQCSCGGSIYTPIWECAACSRTVYDEYKDGELKPKEIAYYQSNKFECPFCGEFDFLVEVKECDKCQNPESLELWQVVLEVEKTGENTDSKLHVLGHTLAEDELDDELLKLIPEDERILERVFLPLSVDEQIKVFGLKSNPFAAEQARGRSREFSPRKGKEQETEQIPPRGRDASRFVRSRR